MDFNAICRVLLTVEAMCLSRFFKPLLLPFLWTLSENQVLKSCNHTPITSFHQGLHYTPLLLWYKTGNLIKTTFFNIYFLAELQNPILATDILNAGKFIHYFSVWNYCNAKIRLRGATSINLVSFLAPTSDYLFKNIVKNIFVLLWNQGNMVWAETYCCHVR